ncbi:hypothetical protein [Dokdonella sp.]|uniref:hypothetical protein n=1 Tax=Dokdonella sp. TaxID=2291710 RepID=UPI0031C287CD|nr:hypothetical protein [Dokdonella sp.]
MKIMQIACAFALGACVAMTAAAQQGGRAGAPDLAHLSQQQIAATELPSALYRLSAMYEKAGDLQRLAWTLERLSQLQPNVGQVRLALARTYGLQGEKSKAYDTLLAMQKQGYGYDLADDPDFAKVADTKVWDYILEGLEVNMKPFGEGQVAFTLPGGDHLFDALAFDPARKQLLAGSVRDGTIQLVGKDGKLAPFIRPDAENGLWSVYALAVDPAEDALYVASNASVYFKGFDKQDFGKAGVFRFKLSSGKFVGKYLLEPTGQPRTLSSLAVGKGRVFAADGIENVIYRLDGGSLKPMVRNAHLTSVRGMTLSGDGKILYFADYSMGVLGVDLAAGKGFDLQYDPAKLVLGGIDGLYWYDGTLVAIQNGMSPERVMRISLSADGRRVTKAMPLDVARPEFELPTYGAIDGNRLYFIANSQRNEYGTYGTPKDGAKLEPVKIFRSDLRFAWDEKGIEMSPVAAPQRKPASGSRPGSGQFSNVQGAAQSAKED